MSLTLMMLRVQLSPLLAAGRIRKCGGTKDWFQRMMKDGLPTLQTFLLAKFCNQPPIKDRTIGAIVLKVCLAFIPYSSSFGCAQSDSIDFQLGSVCM